MFLSVLIIKSVLFRRRTAFHGPSTVAGYYKKDPAGNTHSQQHTNQEQDKIQTPFENNRSFNLAPLRKSVQDNNEVTFPAPSGGEKKFVEMSEYMELTIPKESFPPISKHTSTDKYPGSSEMSIKQLIARNNTMREHGVHSAHAQCGIHSAQTYSITNNSKDKKGKLQPPNLDLYKNYISKRENPFNVNGASKKDTGTLMLGSTINRNGRHKSSSASESRGIGAICAVHSSNSKTTFIPGS